MNLALASKPTRALPTPSSPRPRASRARARLRDKAGPVMRRSFERWFALCGARIREAREHADLSLFELARRANVHSITLSVVELGHKPASLELIYDVAKVLRVDPRELLP